MWGNIITSVLPYSYSMSCQKGSIYYKNKTISILTSEGIVSEKIIGKCDLYVPFLSFSDSTKFDIIDREREGGGS